MTYPIKIKKIITSQPSYNKNGNIIGAILKTSSILLEPNIKYEIIIKKYDTRKII